MQFFQICNMTLFHEDCRSRVCAVCYDEKGRKAEIGRKISAAMEKIIQDNVNSNFSLSDSSLPSGLCTRCRISLTQQNKWNATGKIESARPKKIDIASSYENNQRPPRGTEGKKPGGWGG